MLSLRPHNFAAEDAKIKAHSNVAYKQALDYLDRNQVPYNPSFLHETLCVWNGDVLIHFNVQSRKYFIKQVSLEIEGSLWEFHYNTWQDFCTLIIDDVSALLEPKKGYKAEFCYSGKMLRKVVESDGNKSGAYLLINKELESYDVGFFYGGRGLRLTFWDLYDRSNVESRKSLLRSWFPFVSNPHEISREPVFSR